MKYKIKIKILVILLLLSLFQTSSRASSDWDFLSLHGYGAVGVAYQDDDEVLYRNSLSTAKGSRGDFSLSNYSNLGLQLDATPTDKLTFTVQGIVSENNSEGKLLQLGWANMKYQVNDNLSIKAGKMRIPAFMYSDILTVSYAYDWVKLPEMYSIISFQNYEGIELAHNMEFDNFVIHSILRYGESKSVIKLHNNPESKLEISDLKSVTFKLLYDDLTLRFTYSHNNLKVIDKNLDRVLTPLTVLGIPVISQTIHKYIPKEATYWELGGRYDFENAYLLGEYMQINFDSFLSDTESWYIGAGYNFENWSPFLLYSKTSSQSNYEAIAIDSTMSPQVMGAITVANQTLSAVSNISSIQSETRSVGLRYNLYENAILKFQYDNQKAAQNESISFNFSQDSDVDIHVFSTAINFVF